MNRKIAIFSNGWSPTNVSRTLVGMNEYSSQNENFDIFIFTSHASYSTHNGINRCELNIYDLPHMEDYDGIVVFSNIMNSDETAKELCRRGVEANIPVVSIGMDMHMEGVNYIGLNNDVGMYDLVNHLVDAHNVKRVVYIGGTKDHVDSIARLNIAKEVLAKHGLTIAENDIYYANWGYSNCIEIVIQLLNSEQGLPDAIICANDSTALAMLSELALRGVKLPEDVIITGFDHIEDSKNCYPVITSVEQSYEEVGFNCAKIIYDKLKGVQTEASLIVDSKFVLCESCRCKSTVDYAARRLQVCQFSYHKSIRGGLLSIIMKSLEDDISNSKDFASLAKNLQHHYLNEHIFEGNDFYLMLDSSYFSNLQDDDSEICKNSYNSNMEVVVALKDAQLEQYDIVDRHQLIPGYQKKDKQEIFHFLPLHNEISNCGYIVLKQESSIIKEDVLHLYVGHIQQTLKSLRTNLRLDMLNKNLTALYNKDAMTGLYNRFGYENMAVPMFDHCVIKQENLMVLFVDINSMKKINDVYGHLQGDISIRTVANGIRDNSKEDWIAIRYGGDEFLIIAPRVDSTIADNFINKLKISIDKSAEECSLPYNLTVSCGYVITDPSSQKSLQDYIRDADNLMYEIKRDLHAKEHV